MRGSARGAVLKAPHCLKPRGGLPAGPSTKGRYFADVFCGGGGVGKQALRMGVNARFWDTRYGPSGNVIARPVFRQLISDVRCALVIAMMLAPPCASFSLPFQRDEWCRTKDEPWGLAKISERKRLLVEAGNRTARAALRLARECQKAMVPWCLEHPASSYLLSTPEYLALRAQPSVHFILLDQCQFGASYRKHTALLCGGVDDHDLDRLRKTCGASRRCTRTGRRHDWLEGKKLTQASKYPTTLCRHVAFVLLERARTGAANL